MQCNRHGLWGNRRDHYKVRKISGLATKEKRPQDWSAVEQLMALQESRLIAATSDTYRAE